MTAFSGCIFYLISGHFGIQPTAFLNACPAIFHTQRCLIAKNTFFLTKCLPDKDENEKDLHYIT